jgi:hypothetical protein
MRPLATLAPGQVQYFGLAVNRSRAALIKIGPKDLSLPIEAEIRVRMESTCRVIRVVLFNV